MIQNPYTACRLEASYKSDLSIERVRDPRRGSTLVRLLFSLQSDDGKTSQIPESFRKNVINVKNRNEAFDLAEFPQTFLFLYL